MTRGDAMANRHFDKRTGPSQRQLRVGELVRHALPLSTHRVSRPWTDDYSNLVELLKWTM